MGFRTYEARNKLTGGYMADNTDIRKLKKHIKAKATPGKFVDIYAIEWNDAERLVASFRVAQPSR